MSSRAVFTNRSPGAQPKVPLVAVLIIATAVVRARVGPSRRRGLFMGIGTLGGISAGAAETPETLLLRETLAPELQAAIDALPEAFRQAVWLRDVEEFSYAEIAEMLAIPVGTVMSRISRGRRLLFDRLQHLRPVNA